MRLLQSLPVVVALFGSSLVWAAGEPKIKYTSFNDPPSDYFYFEDSPVSFLCHLSHFVRRTHVPLCRMSSRMIDSTGRSGTHRTVE
jgi:hypothetical protein